jgi:hypothetical protein
MSGKRVVSAKRVDSKRTVESKSKAIARRVVRSQYRVNGGRF